MTLPVLLAVWTLHAAGAAATWLGREWAVVTTFGAATALVAATRRAGARAGVAAAGDPARRWPLPLLAGGLAGLLSFPAWILLVGWVGDAIGLERAHPLAPGAGPLPLALATLCLAPVFEELLYRERVLVALRRRLGPLAAIAVSSLLFAVPHVAPWAVLGTFALGLFLGTLAVAGASMGLCIGYHAGMNFAAALGGIPPEHALLKPELAVPAAAALVALGLRSRVRPQALVASEVPS